MREPWRYRCPEGHTSITRRVPGGYRCDSCERQYHGDPVDMLADDGDTEDGDDPVGPLEAVHRLYAETGDTLVEVPARRVSDRPRAFAAGLRKAADRGYVEHIPTSSAARWRVTETGARLAQHPSELEGATA